MLVMELEWMATSSEYWAGLMFSAWTTCCSPWRIASVKASPSGSFSSGVEVEEMLGETSFDALFRETSGFCLLG